MAEQIRLLVVEDVPQVAMHMRSLLQAQAQIKMLEVVALGRARAGGGERAAARRPDRRLRCSRAGSPGCRSREQVRHGEPTVSVIVLTVPQNPITEDPARGIDAVLKMPFSGFDLTTMVRKVHEQSTEGGRSQRLGA